MKKILTACLLALSCLGAAAQEDSIYGIPTDVYYLMPSFGKGMVYFSGQAPAQGQLNICAVDNTLRFKDKKGQEIVAENTDNVVKVVIDNVSFIRSDGMFYRMYPVTLDYGIALRRDVRIIKDAKQGGYGTTSRTSSTREYSTIYADGVLYGLDKSENYPYEVSEFILLYRGDNVVPLNKKNLRKLFPDKKTEIDEYFKSGGTLPQTLDGTLELLGRWK